MDDNLRALVVHDPLGALRQEYYEHPDESARKWIDYILDKAADDSPETCRLLWKRDSMRGFEEGHIG